MCSKRPRPSSTTWCAWRTATAARAETRTRGTRPRATVDVVTGFLGSGKTTLLRALLAAAPARERIAVIVNEVGEIGVDGRVLTGFDFLENVVELADGCVCCSLDEYRFDFAVDELLRRLDPTLIVIETTGVADPVPTLERLQRCGLGVDAVITVVDALWWKRAWRISSVARRQIRAADFVVVSKLDLAGAGELPRLQRAVRRLAPRAVVLPADRGAVASDVLLATSVSRRRVVVEAARAGDAPADHLVEDAIESFSVRVDGRLDRGDFETFLARLPQQVWRAKGLARLTDGDVVHLFNYTCGRFDLAPLPATPGLASAVGAETAEAVFIGRGLARLRGRIEAALEACVRPRAVERGSRNGHAGASTAPTGGAGSSAAEVGRQA